MEKIEIIRNWIRRENRELFNRHRVYIKEDEKVLKMGTGDGCTTL